MKRFFRALMLIAIALVLVLLVGTFMLKAPESDTEKAEMVVPTAGDIDRLSQALQFPTLSNTAFDPASTERMEAFDAFHAFLIESYPLTFSTLTVEYINRYSLLLTWPGKGTDLPGLVLMAHQDVVPVSQPERWTFDPFSGAREGSRIVGRGALDDKGSMIAQLEAVESLLRSGYTPPSTVYLAYGHDEEIGGDQGAAAIAEALTDRKANIGLVLDEGGAIVTDRLPGISGPVAMVGNAEKGYVSLSLTVYNTGGHSSMPPEQTAIEILAAAITRLKSRPFPVRMDVAARQTLQQAAPYMPFGYRTIMANLWLFQPLVSHLMSKDNGTRAILQTTIATTLFQAGIKDNVLPGRARAVINFRTLPGDSSDVVISHVRDAIDDERVRITVLNKAIEASPVSAIDTTRFATLRQTILTSRPEADLIVVPYLVLGGTDAKHFTRLSNQVFRFSPYSLSKAELESIHGVDEAIEIEEFRLGVHFYRNLMQQQF